MSDIAANRKAYFDYEVLETYEAGVELLGLEVKSVKAGQISLAGSFVVIRGGEAWLLNSVITPLQPKNILPSYDSSRSRRLLLKRAEIRELIGKTAQTGLTIVPLKVYSKHNRVKVEIGLARHKKKHDKREAIKKRDIEREIGRGLK